MTMSIQNLAVVKESSAYYENMYRIWMEAFGPYIRNDFTIQNVTPAVAARYEGDFYGLLDKMMVPKQYHHLITMFNGYRHPGDYDGVNTDIKIPNSGFYDIMRTMYVTATPLLS